MRGGISKSKWRNNRDRSLILMPGLHMNVHTCVHSTTCQCLHTSMCVMDAGQWKSVKLDLYNWLPFSTFQSISQRLYPLTEDMPFPKQVVPLDSGLLFWVSALATSRNEYNLHYCQLSTVVSLYSKHTFAIRLGELFHW